MAINAGSVSVDVVPDLRRFMAEMKTKLRDLSVDLKLNADTLGLREQIDAVSRDLSATIQVDADTTLAAARIDEVARDRTANVRVDSSGFTGAASGMSGMVAAAAALGPALIPVTGAVTGLAAALGAPIAAAGGGLTVFGVIAGIAVKQTKEQIKEIGKLQEKVGKAQLELDSATTKQGKATAQDNLAAATTAYKNALDNLTPSQRKFMTSQEKMKGAFGELIKAAGPAIFDPFIKGMNLLAGVLPRLRPLLQPISDALVGLLTQIGNFTKGPGFKSFLAGFGKQAGGAIATFGRIFGNIARGMFGLFKAFGPLSGPFIKGIADLAKSFADFGKNAGKNKGFQSFLAYIRDVGPKVATTFGHIFKAVGKIAETLAPLGGLVLTLVDGLADLIARAKPAQLAAIAGAIGAIGIAIGIATGGISFVVPLLVALGAGVAYAYTHFKPFRDIVNAVGGFLRDNLLPALRDAAETVMPALKQAFKDVTDTLRDNKGGLKLLGDVFKLVGGYIVKVWIPTLAQVAKVAIPVLVKSFQGAIGGLKLLANAWLGSAQIGVQAFRFLAIMALTTFGDILRGAAKAFGWVPGIGPKIKAASAGFDEFRAQTIRNLNKTAAKIRAVQDALNGIKPKPIILDVITRTHAQGKVDRQLGIPRGATGGIVTQPTLAVIGEAGPEAVVPLNKTPGSRPLAGGSQEIRGTLSLDRQGVATIRGVARDASEAGHKQRDAAARNAAMGSESFK